MRRDDRVWWLLAACVVPVLLLTVAEPLRALVAEALGADGGPWSFLGETGRRGPQALVNTFVLSSVSVLLAGLVGTGLALLLDRLRFPGHGLLEVLAPLPIALPPLVGSFTFLLLFDLDGVLPRLVESLGLAPAESVAARGWAGVLLVHTYTLSPFFYLFVRAALRRVDGAAVEAARSLGAGPRRAFLDATLPQLVPALAAASLLVFLASAGSFTAPWFFAPGKPLMTLAIERARGEPGLQASTTLVLCLATTLVLLALVAAQRRARGATSHGVPPARRELRGSAAWVAGALAGVLVAVLLLPHAALLLLSFHDVEAWTTEPLPPAYTLEHYVTAFGSWDALRPAWTSLWTSTIGVAAATGTGLAAAALVVSRRVPGRLAVGVLAMLPFAVPGTALAVNLLFAFNTGRWFTGGVALGGTTAILALAYHVRSLPIAYQGAAAALARLPGDLVPAARSLGATPVQAFRTVVLPALAPALAAAALLTFVTSLGEFVASLLLYPPGGEPIAIHIAGLYRNGNSLAVPAAYSAVFTVLVLALSVVARRRTA